MSKRPADRATPLLMDRPEVRTALVADVAPLKPIDRVLSYQVPEEWSDRLTAGMRVRVPMGKKQRLDDAVCLAVSRRAWKSSLKPIAEIIDPQPFLSSRMIELGRWIARYYASHLGRTLDLMVPAPAKERTGWRRVKYARPAADAPTAASASADVESKAQSGRGLSPKQARVMQVLREFGEPMPVDQVCARADCTPAVLVALAGKNIIEFETRREPRPPPIRESPAPEDPAYELTADQKAAINQVGTAVASHTFSVQVLFGVTGSGKTEVYVHAIKQALSEGRQAILLVPEIALTTQTVVRLERRFPRVATLHSGLTGVQRSQVWSAIAGGAVPVVIGTRSAVFAPCPNLGAIIVDEESEPSYKNLAAPRFHTRDVAIMRGQLENVPVVLGSAAPSLETWRNVRQRKHYHLIRMPHRVRGLAMPTVDLVDMRHEHVQRPGVHMLSREMEAHLTATLDRAEQAVLLLNRRGFAGYLHCPKCKTVITCPHCSVHMVFHATTGLAHCHYCRAKLAIPTMCPIAACGGKLVRFGIGTQRVEEELRRKFPSARVRRMDSDAMQNPRDYADILTAFEAREFDVLVGTQMIAKGLDFPFVSFVGVVSADTALGLSDFRSEERTFQLVLQVAGRSGRGQSPGHVVVQTFAADATPIQHAVKGDYEGFADQELQKRRRANLPPWSRLVRVVLSDGRLTKLQNEAARLARDVDELLQKIGITAACFGPAAAPIQRLRDQYRYEIQWTFQNSADLLAAIDRFKAENTFRARVSRIIVDVDPISLQ